MHLYNIVLYKHINIILLLFTIKCHQKLYKNSGAKIFVGKNVSNDKLRACQTGKKIYI